MSPTDPYDAPAADWSALRDRLAADLAALADGEFVIAGEPAPEPPPRRGLLRRRAPVAPHRYVQFLRVGEGIRAECVGARLFGGDLDISPEVHERLRASGWLAPADDVDDATFGRGYPNYRVLGHLDEAPRLAGLGVDALALLGLRPGEVSVDHG